MRALFVGAHPDDVELGCGGALCKLIEAGHDATVLVLTQEQDLSVRKRRQSECRAALALAGVNEAMIHFCAFEDGGLKADANAVSGLRRFLAERAIEPDIVFCHSASDSHGDHRAAHDLCRSTFRGVSFLFYHVVNSGSTSDFRPNLWIDISKQLELKSRILQRHASQIERGRILWERLDSMHRRMAECIVGAHAEAFETLTQEGDLDGATNLAAINDNAFTRLWGTLGMGPGSEEHPITILYGRSVGAIVNRCDGDTFNLDVAALCHLQSRLVAAFPQNARRGGPAVRSAEASAYSDDSHFQNGNVLLLGGPGSNNATLRIFNQLPALRYRVEYAMPYYRDIWICDLLSGEKIRARYREQLDETYEVVEDFAILSVIRNPYFPDGFIVGAMGVHGYGTLSVARLLGGDDAAGLLLEYLERLRADAGCEGFQVLVSTSDGGLTSKLHPASHHEIRSRHPVPQPVTHSRADGPVPFLEAAQAADAQRLS